ncbi:MAG: phosphodiester glycosidase family protein [Armatimonadota bacterium]|nr:phosphodiester glycosidase family protein [bacterium]
MIRTLSIVVLLGLVLCDESSASSIAYAKVKMGRTVAHTVTVNLADPQVRVTVALAKGGAGSSESFKSIVRRVHPAAAITGTFFDTKTLIPTGDIALFGTVVHSGCIGSALCIDHENKASVVPIRKGRQQKWAGYETVLCAGPTLVAKGKVAIALKHEGFRRSLCAPARRTAVGITKAGKLLIVAINRDASLYQIAKVMVKLHTVDAVCLDGGSSTGFYHDGRFLAMPSRSLTNCLLVYATPADYRMAKSELAPARLFASAETLTLEELFSNIPLAIGNAFAPLPVRGR